MNNPNYLIRKGPGDVWPTEEQQRKLCPYQVEPEEEKVPVRSVGKFTAEDFIYDPLSRKGYE
jgi:hypothetical protein